MPSFRENVSGNRVVKAFAKEDFEIEKFNKENDAYMDAQLNSSKVWMKYLPIFEVLAYVLNVVLMLYGGWMVITGEMTIGNLVTVNGYLWMLNAPLRMAGWWVNDTHRFITSVEKNLYNLCGRASCKNASCAGFPQTYGRKC